MLAVLDDELRSIQARIQEMERSTSQAIEAGKIAADFFDPGTTGVEHDVLIRALYNLGRDPTAVFELTTYEDLIATGSLRLHVLAECR